MGSLMKTSDLFVQCLEMEGVEYVFAFPGEENLDLLESLRAARIEVIVTRHEQGAAFMAATYARLTGKVGVCLATLGGMPMLAITGQKGIRENWQADFQIIDVVNMMKPLTKRTIRSRDPTQLRRRSARPSSWPRPSGSAPATLSCPRMWRGKRRIRSCGHSRPAASVDPIRAPKRSSSPRNRSGWRTTRS